MIVRLAGVLVLFFCALGLVYGRFALRVAGKRPREVVGASSLLTGLGLLAVGTALTFFSGGRRLGVALLLAALYLVGLTVVLVKRARRA